MNERPYLRGLFLVGLLVVAVLAVVAAGGGFAPESEQSQRIRSLADEVRTGH